MKILFSSLMLAALSAIPAMADITIVFDQPNQMGQPGQTLEFFGTITNNGSDTVFLNSDDVNLTSPSLTVNDLFFSNVPVSLDPGQSSGDIELFDVMLSNPLLDTPATHLGIYTLFGGRDGDAQDNLASATFSVNTTPEPAGIFLLLGVFAILILISRRRLTAAPKA